MEYIVKIIFVVFSYLMGSIPSGIIVARCFKGVDPRSAGSGNIGATNVARTLGKKAGLLTLGGDVLKGALPTSLAYYIAAGTDTVFIGMVGFSSFLGHLFPVFLGFKGGKGVATACGVFLVISPLAVLLSALVFASLLALTRYVSAGSIISALSMPVILWALGNDNAYIVLGIAIAFFIILKHLDNIKRLLIGKENRFSL